MTDFMLIVIDERKETLEKLSVWSSSKKRILVTRRTSDFSWMNWENHRGISTRNTWNIGNNRSLNGPSDSLINWTVSGRMLIAVHQSLKRDFVKVVGNSIFGQFVAFASRCSSLLVFYTFVGTVRINTERFTGIFYSEILFGFECK